MYYSITCNGATIYTAESGVEALKLASIIKDNISHGVQYRCGWFHKVDEIPIGSGYVVKWTENEKKEEVIIKVERMES